MMNAEDAKTLLRRQILEKRNHMSDLDLAEKSLEIEKRIVNSQVYQTASHIFLYYSMPKEVNTKGLITQAWKDNKKVMLPIAKKGGKMYFVPYEPEDVLLQSKFGVMEPQKDSSEEKFPQEGDLFLVPGVVFDKNGGRIGYGGGFYDRYFAKGGCYKKIGVAFSFQVMEENIIQNPLDIKVDELITEEGWIGGR
jgi:5-formyltetrahydrofolate cyclo-ligase